MNDSSVMPTASFLEQSKNASHSQKNSRYFVDGTRSLLTSEVISS
jgi:hypothetical protein